MLSRWACFFLYLVCVCVCWCMGGSPRRSYVSLSPQQRLLSVAAVSLPRVIQPPRSLSFTRSILISPACQASSQFGSCLLSSWRGWVFSWNLLESQKSGRKTAPSRPLKWGRGINESLWGLHRWRRKELAWEGSEEQKRRTGKQALLSHDAAPFRAIPGAACVL